jgi:subtilisin family serine protease
LSALVRRFAAVIAVLAIAGAFVPGTAVVATARPTVITNFPVHTEFPNDPFYVDQWGLQSVGAPNAWGVNLGNSSVVVAVVDTGVWWTQPDIQANMWTNPIDGSHGYDFVNGDTNPMDIDPSGIYHGTGVAGVIAALINNGQGIAGTAQVSVMAVRALGSNGQGSSQNVSQGIRYAADHGAKVINLSLGTNQTFLPGQDMELAIDYAWSKGALITAAAGNSGTGTLDYPARLPNVVSVAAIDETGSRASFSNYGPGLSLSAPGDRILTLDGSNNGNAVHYLRGTSFSTPFVTGVAALLLSQDPNLTNRELWNYLNQTAVQPGGAVGVYNTNYGWGVVNAWNALNALNQPSIFLNLDPSSVSSSSKFDVTWSVLGPVGMAVSDTHVVWGTQPGALGNSTSAQSGLTRQSYTASGLSLPSGAGALYFKVVATVNGTLYESPEKVVGVSSVPDFLFVLYQLLASNLLYLALFILVLAGVVAFIPQRRAARARRAVSRPQTMYPSTYYIQAAPPPQPPTWPAPSPPAASRYEPYPAGPPPPAPAPASPPAAPSAPIPPGAKKRCPNCGTMVNADNMFCFFCGHPFQ